MKRVWAYSENVQQLILNCHAYFRENCPSQSVKETCKALKISRATVKRIIKRGKVKPANRRKKTKKQFSKVDSFTKDLTRRTAYSMTTVQLQRLICYIQNFLKRRKEKNMNFRMDAQPCQKC